MTENDLSIYYSSLSSPHFINCWGSRWDVQDYSIIIETWMKKDDMLTIQDNTVPGAVGELYKILGRPLYYDSTWQGGNTIKLSPIDGYELSNMRSEKLIYPKSISTSPQKGDSGWLNVKIEGYISGTGSI